MGWEIHNDLAVAGFEKVGFVCTRREPLGCFWRFPKKRPFTCTPPPCRQYPCCVASTMRGVFRCERGLVARSLVQCSSDAPKAVSRVIKPRTNIYVRGEILPIFGCGMRHPPGVQLATFLSPDGKKMAMPLKDASLRRF